MSNKKKPTAPAPKMTPELYHLEHGPKIRDTIKADIASAEDYNATILEKEVRAELKSRGFTKIDDLKCGYGDRVTGVRNGVEIRFELQHAVEVEVKARAKKKQKDVDSLHAARKFLCANLTPNGAKRFGAFCRTKYGKNADAALIERAYGEWLELNSTCTC